MRLGPLRGPILGPQPQHKKEQQPDADAYCPEAPGRELRLIHFPVIGEATLGDGPARVQREQQTNDDKGRQRCQDTIHRSLPSYPSQVCLRYARLAPRALDSAGNPAALNSQLGLYHVSSWFADRCCCSTIMGLITGPARNLKEKVLDFVSFRVLSLARASLPRVWNSALRPCSRQRVSRRPCLRAADGRSPCRSRRRSDSDRRTCTAAADRLALKPTP